MLEKNDGSVEDFLGEPPHVDVDEARVLEFYLSVCRAGTPGDQPVNRADALLLWERLHGEAHVSRLFGAIGVMEGVYAGDLKVRRAEDKERSRKQAREGSDKSGLSR